MEEGCIAKVPDGKTILIKSMKEHSGLHEAQRAARAFVSDWSRSPIPLSEEVQQSSKTSKNTAIISLISAGEATSLEQKVRAPATSGFCQDP